MTEQQIPKLVASFVQHQAKFSPLSVEAGKWVTQNASEAIALFIEAVKDMPKGAPLEPELLLSEMTEQQIPKLVASLVENQAKFSPLPVAAGQWAIRNVSEAIALFIKAVEDKPKGAPLEPELLLEAIGTVTISATGEFITKDKFVVNTSRKAPVRISYLGNNFKTWFLGKVEKSAGESELCYHKLLKLSLDAPIIAALGDEEKVEIALAQMFYLLEKQGDGKQGVFLTNNCANIFYIRDVNGTLRAVHTDWDGDSWHVHAYLLGYPWWRGGSQVFSPQF